MNIGNYIFANNIGTEILDFGPKNKSYASICIETAISLNKQYADAQKKLYRSLYEANNDQLIINESFTEFTNTCKDIVGLFLKSIKDIEKEYAKELDRLLKDKRAKFLKEKDDMNKYPKGSFIFLFNGFIYTIDHTIPAPIAGLKFKSDFPPSILDAEFDLKKFNDKLQDKLNTKFYDEFRRDVIKADHPIEAKDFGKECVMAFRGGEHVSYVYDVTREMLQESMNRFINYKDSIDQVLLLIKDLETDYNDILKYIKADFEIKNDRGAFNNKYNVPNNPNAKSDIQVERYLKLKTDQIQKMSEIHLIAFGYTLDALTDSLKEDTARTLYALMIAREEVEQ